MNRWQALIWTNNDGSISSYCVTRPQLVMLNSWPDTGGFSLGQLFLAAAKQLYEWFSPSVPPSHTFFTMFPSSYHHEILGVITNDRSDVHAKGKGQRSKVKVTEVETKLSCLQTVTPFWIHIWQWNDGQSLMWLRRGALIAFLRSHS